ncbi:2-succinyl-5-enolpyruvyl-6-hydroxy-3-cyclohexene-1-carboxylic-acid synthase [Bacillus niameyensis]|uniref:2-succinyl-5-enolpyruvyl-6-hydroxy-3- cyclohexene-1-carboxylic-acid synthase n=1 Tax=Bacillus niameyensis TaxID=1522308 RepID=UPI000783B15B|nr:2-succinyl-5-enolpyruvyl-6-hydroxy-3-cyclohexene-1-carboxylic-acid synthase [Bacillus niameyensis]
MNQHQEALTQYLAAFIVGLVQSGVRDVVISPGSRSTPLALLMAEHPDLQVYIEVDERSAGFFALGLAKATASPVALLCTSGTASANYFPAVVEADLSRIPLIVLTADRPHELRDVGAPQAINQLHLYGHHVRWFSEMALPDSGQTIYAKTTARRAVKEAMALKKGPVHLNFPLREPLIPNLNPVLFTNEEEPLTIESGHLSLSLDAIERLADQLKSFEKGIIVCGPIDQQNFPSAVLQLAERLGFPILADPLSQLRSVEDPNGHVIDSYDAILKSSDTVEYLEPDIVIRFGAMPVSKPLTLFMKKYNKAKHIIIDGGAGWRDPSQIASQMIYCDEVEFCEKVSILLEKRSMTSWLSIWKKIDQIAKETISNYMLLEDDLEEGKAVYEFSKCLPAKSTVFVGNSMPIRDVDTFFHKTDKNIHIMANRGANGIDGVVSTAMGVSVHKRPLFLVIGDLSFFHDMNGLLAAKLHKLNITIILLNNDGGGIFSYLPQAAEPKHFEILFGTPTGLDFEHAVRMYNGKYTKISDWDQYKLAISNATNHEGLNVIEVPTDRMQNLTSHQEMWKSISREINGYLQGVKK